MNGPEERLRALPRMAPSPGLEERIQALFREAAVRPPAWYHRPVPCWCVLAGCVAGVVIGALLSPPATHEPVWISPVAYEVPLAPEMRNAFGLAEPESAASSFGPSWTIVEFSVEPPFQLKL